MSKVFVTVDELQENARWIDTRFDLANSAWGFEQYKAGHVEGAIYWHLENDLSNMTSQEGRHPMPSKQQLQSLFERSGLQLHETIYIYDQGAAPFAARAWFLLTYAGFDKAFIVNGGTQLLRTHTISWQQQLPIIVPTTVAPIWQDAMYADVKDVEAIVEGEQQATLIDARANIRYRGEHEPIDPIAGHIPTAKNFDWEQLKALDGMTLQFHAELDSLVQKDENLVVYCGSGVTASPLYAVLKHAGFDHSRLYMGSYSDWIRDHVVEKGQNI